MMERMRGTGHCRTHTRADRVTAPVVTHRYSLPHLEPDVATVRGIRPRQRTHGRSSTPWRRMGPRYAAEAPSAGQL